MSIVTAEQFEEGLKKIPSISEVTIRARIIPQMRKTNNPYYDRVHKIVVAKGRVGADYENALNQGDLNLGGEGDLLAGPRSWGTTVHRCFVEHKGKLYTRFFEESRQEFWFLDGNRVKDGSTILDQIKSFIPEKKDRYIVYRGKSVHYRNFTAHNHLAVRWNKRTYYLDYALVPRPERRVPVNA